MKVNCAYDKLVPLHELKQHPKNRNKHNKEQIQRLAKILEHQGWRSPIKVSNQSGKITSGHGRLMAALHLGWIEAPVDLQDYESEDQEYADVIADNEIARWAELDLSGVNLDLADLGPDFDLDLLGINGFTLDPEKLEPQCDEDEVPEKVEPKAKLGDIYQLGQHRLMCGDSTSIDAVEKLMDGEKADMVFTDPPYGDGHAAMDVDHSRALIGKGIVTKQHQIASDKNLDFLPEAVNTITPFLNEGATKLLFFKWSKWREVEDATAGWGSPSAVCVWDREKIAAATFRFNPVHEFCFHWGSQADKRCRGNLTNVWRLPKESESKQLHPTVKPQGILIPAIEVCTDPGNAIVDLFGGSGSTLIACEKTNRKCFMMELDPHYVSVILARWEAYTGRKAELLNGTT
jgi:DNA modification methylase